MHVMYTANKNFIEIMLTSIYSLILNGNLESINLHIITENCDESDFYKIHKFLDQFNNISVDIYKLEDKPINEYGIPNWKNSQIANARIFYPRIIKERHPEVKNLLYIDCDTIIKGDLNELTSYDEYPINAALDETTKDYYEKGLGLTKYHNSGVLYINTNEWDKLDIEYRVKDFCKTPNIKISYPDQDILNITLKDEIHTIPNRFNLSLYPYIFKMFGMKIRYEMQERQISYKDILEAKENAAILHSLGLFNIKPWYNSKINPLTEEFMQYMKDIDPNFKLKELSRFKKIITISPTFFKSIILIKPYIPIEVEKKIKSLVNEKN